MKAVHFMNLATAELSNYEGVWELLGSATEEWHTLQLCYGSDEGSSIFGASHDLAGTERMAVCEAKRH